MMKKLISMIFIGLFFTSCVNYQSNTKNYEPLGYISSESIKTISKSVFDITDFKLRILSGSELTNRIKIQTRKAKIKFSPVMDDNYFIIPISTVNDIFNQFNQYLNSLNVDYTQSFRDCDDYTFAFRHWFQFIYYTGNDIKSSPPILSVLVRQKKSWGDIPKGDNHMLIGLETDRGLVIYEPQTNKWCEYRDYPNRNNIYYIIY